MVMIAISMLIALVLSLLFGIPYIALMKKKMYSQYLREEVAQMHAGKEKTPTTGGIFIMCAILITSIVVLCMAEQTTTRALLVLLIFVFYASTGFQDDLMKIKGHKNEGLSARGKLLLQIAVAMLPAFYLIFAHQTEISFMNFTVNLGYFYPVFAAFMIVGASNAVNLTDGLDGLATSCSFFAFLACTIFCYLNGYVDLAIVSGAVCAACAGFYYYNKKPAQIFMGDTGSLALGGLLAVIAIMGKFELWLIPISVIFICETLSVMIQVGSYKLFKRRVFKMAPIHHHFELLGWSEKRIVYTFAIISALGGILAVWLFIWFRTVGV